MREKVIQKNNLNFSILKFSKHLFAYQSTLFHYHCIQILLIGGNFNCLVFKT